MWTLYASPKPCTYCAQARDLLAARGVEYEEVEAADLGAALAAGHGLRLPAGPRTYPQVVDGEGALVGGFRRLRDRLDEPLLDRSLARYTPIPVRHHDIFNMYKSAQKVAWVSEEIDYAAGDLAQWQKLPGSEQRFLKHVLAFFAAADGIVLDNLMNNFKDEVQYAEARQFYAVQAHMEAVHSETYGNLLTLYVPDDREVEALLHGIETMACLRAKAAWSMKWLDGARPFAERLLAFVCVEGIMFSGSFCAIFWVKQRNLLPALTYSNDLISRDEGLHQQFGELLYTRHLRHRLPEEAAHAIVGEAVAAEAVFVRDSVGEMRDPHLDAARMTAYVEYVADRILSTLGYRPLFGSAQPFPWMEGISLRGINNFFEKRSEAYVDANVACRDRPVFGQAEDEDF